MRILKIGKSGHYAKANIRKMVSWGQPLKLAKACEKRLYKHIGAGLCKEQLEKPANIRKMRLMFEKWPLCKGYSLCKMASLGHTRKLRKACEKRLYKHIRDSGWVKRLGKTANIQKIRRF